MKITEIKPNPNNPRIIKDNKFKQLVKSIQDFPQMLELRPIVIDENNIVLGGNMRLKACQEAGLIDVPVVLAKDLTEEQKKEFIVKDNVGYGEWDWSDIANNWEIDLINEWGLDIPGFELNAGELSEEFSLPSGDKSPFQQMTFTLADEQAEQIKNAIEEIKRTEEYKYVETMGNENSNGNALYLIIMQWAEQKKS
jgi:ParB-like chromosome segregation protein Spo0J